MSVDPSSYLFAGWSKTQWIKENEVRDWFSVLCAACGADVCQIWCQMWQLWALVLSDMLLFSLSVSLPHSLLWPVSSILSFSLEEGLPHHTEGLFWDLTSPSLQQPSYCSHFVWPTGTSSCCGGNYMGVCGVTGDAKVTAYTGASTLALTPTRLVLYIVQYNTTYMCKKSGIFTAVLRICILKRFIMQISLFGTVDFKQMHPKHRHLHFYLWIWNNENKY